jgi:hypothetical protein
MKGPVAGFSKGVNDSLIAASTLVHFKATGLLGFALTLSGIVLSRPPEGAVAQGFHFAGVFLLVASACFAGAAIYPMKNTRRRGVLFWGDIVTHPSAEAYAKDLEKMASAEDVEREYAFTNYRLSLVLEGKYGLIRWALCLLLLGAAVAGMGRVIR